MCIADVAVALVVVSLLPVFQTILSPSSHAQAAPLSSEGVVLDILVALLLVAYIVVADVVVVAVALVDAFLLLVSQTILSPFFHAPAAHEFSEAVVCGISVALLLELVVRMAVVVVVIVVVVCIVVVVVVYTVVVVAVVACIAAVKQGLALVWMTSS